MAKNDNQIWTWIGIVVLVLFIFYYQPKEPGMEVIYYKDGQRVSYPFSIIEFEYDEISFNIRGTNIEDTPIIDMQIADAYPQELKDALPSETYVQFRTSDLSYSSGNIAFNFDCNGIELNQYDYISGPNIRAGSCLTHEAFSAENILIIGIPRDLGGFGPMMLVYNEYDSYYIICQDTISGTEYYRVRYSVTPTGTPESASSTQEDNELSCEKVGLDIGETDKLLFTSGLIDTTLLETYPQPITFWVSISGKNKFTGEPVYEYNEIDITIIPSVLPSLPISYWKFDEDAQDSVGTSHGTFEGDAQIIDDAERGQVLSLDGDTDYIDLGDYNALNGATRFSISFWIKPAALPFPGHAGIIGIGSNLKRTPWVWSMSGQSYLQTQFQTTVGDYGSLNMGAVTQDTWQHVVLTWDGTTCSSYINTAYQGSCTTIGDILADSDNHNYIGYIYPYAYFNGEIDEVIIYDGALTLDEINELFLG